MRTLLWLAAGVILGLIFTAMIRKFFVDTSALAYPMGQAAAETLIAGDRGGKKSLLLFISMGVTAVFTFLRDWFMLLPQMLFSKVAIPGVSFGVWLSPMMIAVGYIIGPLPLLVWFIGALIGDFGVVLGGTSLGLWDMTIASAIKTSLGMGVMVGTGIGIILKGILPHAKEIFGPMFRRAQRGDSIVNLRWAPWLMLILAAAFTWLLDMGLLASILTILGVWLTTAMSAQIVGQSGINPMEVFGVIVLLAARAASSIGQLEAFFVAAIVAVACGLVGDVMNDFKAGQIVKSDPKAQWFGEAIGGVVGAAVSVAVLLVLVKAYGTGAFGPGQTFVAAQASVVAAMVGGIPHIPAFVIGLLAGAVLYLLRVPVMTLGLGIYLPFYLSLTAFVGGALKFVVEKAAPRFDQSGKGLIIASGCLGGEAVIGVVIALIQVCLGLTLL